MSLIIKYIATVDVATGVIESVATAPGADLPVEGIIGDKEIIWIPSEGWEDKDNLIIHKEYYRKDGAWVHRGPPPTRSYIWDTETEEWVFNPTDFWAVVRAERNRRLFEVDYTQMADADISDEDKAAWAVYRQGLRDITTTNSGVTRIEDITWPNPPVFAPPEN